MHDFADRDLGELAKAIPYGIYDVANDEGWVSVGDVADTAEFAVESIRRWWNQMGRARFPDADRLLITADAGGSNGYRLRAWKVELARLAAETGLRHHRLPLPARHQQVEPDRAPHVQLHHHELAGPAPHQPAHHHRAHLRHQPPPPGSPSKPRYDPNWYPTGVKITDTELAAVPLHPHDFHGEWNYTITATPNA